MQSAEEQNRYKTIHVMVPEYFRLPGEIYILGKTWQLKTRAQLNNIGQIETYEARVCGSVGILLRYSRVIAQISGVLENLFDEWTPSRYKITLENEKYFLTKKN